MSDVMIDASELTAFGRRVAAAHAMASVKVAQAVKKGAQNVKEKTQQDIRGSGNKGIRIVHLRYEMGSTGTQIYADIGPVSTGADKEKSTGPSVAAIAFYGTARGGGTHKPPEHYAEEELPTFAEYVGAAADDMLIGAIL